MVPRFGYQTRDFGGATGPFRERLNYLKVSVQDFAVFFDILVSDLVFLHHKLEDLPVDGPCLIERFNNIRTVRQIGETQILPKDLLVMTGFVLQLLGYRDFVPVEENNHLRHIFGRVQKTPVTLCGFPHISLLGFGLSYQLG